MNRYLNKYLLDNADNALAKKYIDFFKIELDWHIYNGDSHISPTYYRDKHIPFNIRLIQILQYLIAIYRKPSPVSSGQLNILSAADFPRDNPLNGLGYKVFSPAWHAIGKENIIGDKKTIRWHKDIQKLLRKSEFNAFLDTRLHQNLESFQEHLLSQYQKFDLRALILSTDQSFYSKYSIDIFSKMQRPSFVFSHGLPAIYSKEVDHRPDYLMVWGKKIKENYLNAGFDESKVKVIGHPKYKALSPNKSLRSDLSDVLVIPVSSAIYHQHEYEAILTDRSVVVLYLYMVQSVLQKLGLKKVRYRVHPAVNKSWVHSFLDQNFYIQDTEPLNVSLGRSSLLIGSTSTLLLESLIFGVNYVLFEPTDENGKNLLNYKTVPPFDGGDVKVAFANSEKDLELVLKDNVMTDYTLVHDYIQPLDTGVIKQLIR